MTNYSSSKVVVLATYFGLSFSITNKFLLLLLFLLLLNFLLWSIDKYQTHKCWSYIHTYLLPAITVRPEQTCQTLLFVFPEIPLKSALQSIYYKQAFFFFFSFGSNLQEARRRREKLKTRTNISYLKVSATQRLTYYFQRSSETQNPNPYTFWVYVACGCILKLCILQQPQLRPIYTWKEMFIFSQSKACSNSCYCNGLALWILIVLIGISLGYIAAC